MTIPEQLAAEVARIAKREGLSPEAQKMLIWFGKRALVPGSSIDSSELHQQLMLLGEALMSADEESKDD